MNRVIRLAEVESAEEMPAEPEMHNKIAPAINTEHLRMTEAILFAASQPLDDKQLAQSLPEGADLAAILAELVRIYESRGVNLVKVAGKWQFRTAPDLAFLLRKEQVEQKRLSRAAIETLATIA